MCSNLSNNICNTYNLKEYNTMNFLYYDFHFKVINKLYYACIYYIIIILIIG